MRNFLEISRRYWLAPVCVAVMGVAHADDAPPAPPTASAETQFVSRIASSFESFAGSRTNAESLALGLRQGQAVTLTSTAEGSQTATFTPPTRPMGHGNVVHALSLAQAQLAAQGITQPSPEQLQTALMGGTVTTGADATAQTTTYAGILQLRSQGMGWGKIAHTIGVKPGRGTLNATAGAGSDSGVVTASSERIRARQEFRREDAAGEPRVKRRFEQRVEARESHGGIVTAAGERARVRQESRFEARSGDKRIEHRFEHRVDAPAQNRGIVTASGTPAGAMLMHGRSHGLEAGVAASGSSSSVVTAGGGAGRGDHSRGRGRGGHK